MNWCYIESICIHFIASTWFSTVFLGKRIVFFFFFQITTFGQRQILICHFQWIIECIDVEWNGLQRSVEWNWNWLEILKVKSVKNYYSNSMKTNRTNRIGARVITCGRVEMAYVTQYRFSEMLYRFSFGTKYVTYFLVKNENLLGEKEKQLGQFNLDSFEHLTLCLIELELIVQQRRQLHMFRKLNCMQQELD